MKKERSILLAVAITFVLLSSNLLNFTVSTKSFSESYPSTVCPPSIPGLSTAISLTSAEMQLRKTGTNSMKTKTVKVSRYAVTSQSAIIESEEVTPVVWQARKGVWAGSVACSAPATSQWFIGATADITSKGSLNLVNSGLGRALVSVSVFTEKGSLTPQEFIVKANSYENIPLVSLAPGAKRISIHVVPKSGRVNAFLIDERGKGLRALGGDVVNPSSNPEKLLEIPAIPQLNKRNLATSHTLRLLVPGEINARISAEIRSTDGTFSPVGINGKVIANQKVIEIPMNIKMDSGIFALIIKSDQPILGSVFSKTLAEGKSDFVWSTSAPKLSDFTLATTGLAPTLVFTGKSVRATLEVVSSKGELRSVIIRGEDIATYKVSASTRSVRFTKIARGVTGAALISSKSGYGYLPLTPGSVLTKSAIPTSNISVLNP
ncbi:MAG: hypothetical protein F2851_00540 [Actinobacteria bacterium]|uniref:Unannotated protein n=1 Tax=freshwater metagenome TaxID=449393 RepID=A0A6J5YIB9_9ZZZZ|nr:hypothetical protein [Actinomycetota bacterium]